MHAVTLNDLIEAALREQPYNNERLGRRAQRYCDVVTRHLCPDLPEDLHEDIFQESFAELLRIGTAGLDKHSGLTLFRRMIFSAVRIVRSDYAPPGARTRSAKDAPERIAAEDVGWTVSAADLARCTFAAEQGGHIDFDRFESREAAAVLQQMEDRIDGERLLARAPAAIATALRLICLDGELVEHAAERVRMDRFKLYREVATFRANLAAAA